MIQILACFLGFSSNREWAFPRSSSFKAFRLCSLLRKNTKFFLHDINRNRTQFDSKSKQREEPEDCLCSTNRIFFWRSHGAGRKRRASRSWSRSSTWPNTELLSFSLKALWQWFWIWEKKDIREWDGKRDSYIEEMNGFLTNPLFGILNFFFFSNSFFC